MIIRSVDGVKENMQISFCKDLLHLSLTCKPKLMSFSKLLTTKDRLKFCAILGNDYTGCGVKGVGPKKLNAFCLKFEFDMSRVTKHVLSKFIKGILFSYDYSFA